MSVIEMLPQVNIYKADLAPLMSTLLGRNIPVNSVGLLPHQLLDMHPLDIAQVLFIFICPFVYINPSIYLSMHSAISLCQVNSIPRQLLDKGV